MTTMKPRWGKKSIEIESYLNKRCRRVRYKGVTGKYIGNFSRVARRFGVTRELVRQIAEAEGITPLRTANPVVQRYLLKKGMKA